MRNHRRAVTHQRVSSRSSSSLSRSPAKSSLLQWDQVFGGLLVGFSFLKLDLNFLVILYFMNYEKTR